MVRDGLIPVTIYAEDNDNELNEYPLPFVPAPGDVLVFEEFDINSNLLRHARCVVVSRMAYSTVAPHRGRPEEDFTNGYIRITVKPLEVVGTGWSYGGWLDEFGARES